MTLTGNEDDRIK